MCVSSPSGVRHPGYSRACSAPISCLNRRHSASACSLRAISRPSTRCRAANFPSSSALNCSSERRNWLHWHSKSSQWGQGASVAISLSLRVELGGQCPRAIDERARILPPMQTSRLFLSRVVLQPWSPTAGGLIGLLLAQRRAPTPVLAVDSWRGTALFKECVASYLQSLQAQARPRTAPSCLPPCGRRCGNETSTGQGRREPCRPFPFP